MATKSMKSRIEKWIICLVILIPAIVLVSLYPKMGKIYEERLEKQIAREEEVQNETSNFAPMIQDNFVNYAMEASYYLYGQILQKASSESSDFAVMDENGWINDYYQVNEGCVYLADYFSEDGSYEYLNNGNMEYSDFMEQLFSYGVEENDLFYPFQERGFCLEDYGYFIKENGNLKLQENFQHELSEDMDDDTKEEIQFQKYPDTKEVHTENQDLGNADFENHDFGNLDFLPYNGYLLIDFDSFGNITDIFYKSLMDEKIFYDQSYLYSKAMESIRQYEHNVKVHNENGLEEVEANALRPKNFRGIFLVKNDSGFVYTVNNYVNPMSNLNYYVYHQMNVEWILFAMAGFVALMALILPFIKKIYEGKGRVLNLSLESSLISLFLSALSAYVLYHIMTVSSLRYIDDRLQIMGAFELVGRDVSANEIYHFVLILSFIGWCFCFAFLYFGVASLRKFLENPKTYLKEKFLSVKVLRYSIGHGRKYVIGFWSVLKKICYFICHVIKKSWKNFLNWLLEWQLDSKSKFFILKVVVLQCLLVLAAVLLFNTLDLWIFVIYAAITAFCMWLWIRRVTREYSSISKATEEMAGGNLKTDLSGDFGPFKSLAENLKKIQTGFSEAVAKEASSQNMKTELITNVSHDLKTPLTAIITYVDLLKKEDITEEERRQYIETLEKKSARLKVLIEDLFEISKATSNNIKMNYADVDIVNLLKQLKLENEDKFEKSSLNFIWNLPDEKLMLRLDPNRTYRIIDNLIQNILKYSMEESRVYIDLKANQQDVLLTLKNMSATAMNFDAKEITERFVRGDLSRNTEGSGLGLAIAKSFTELQGGRFEISVDGDLFKVEIQFARENVC